MADISNVHEAKTHLSELLEHARAGEEIVIAKASRPVAKLVPFAPRPRARVAGLGAGAIAYSAEDSDAALAAEFRDGRPDDPLDVSIREQARRHKGAGRRRTTAGRAPRRAARR